MPPPQRPSALPQLGFGMLALILAAGCGGGGSEEASFNFCGESSSQPPVLEVTSVVSSATHTPVSEVILSNFTIDGGATPTAAIYLVSNASLVASGIHCTVPCGFAIAPGNYEFSASAVGYASKAMSVRADYTTRVEGCVTQYFGATPVAIELAPL